MPKNNGSTKKRKQGQTNYEKGESVFRNSLERGAKQFPCIMFGAVWPSHQAQTILLT